MNEFCAWLAAHGLGCLDFTAAVAGVVGVALGIWQSVWTWPVGIVNVGLTFVAFRRAGLYSDMSLQVVYLALSIYGWYQWLRGGVGHSELKVSRTPRDAWPIFAGAGVVMWLALGTITKQFRGAAIPYIDAAMVSTSLIAQYMITRKLIENWIVWIVVDTAYVALFIWRGMYAFAVLYAVYLVLAVFGLRAWKKALA